MVLIELEKKLINFENSCDSSIDLLADRVQSLLGKTVRLEQIEAGNPSNLNDKIEFFQEKYSNNDDQVKSSTILSSSLKEQESSEIIQKQDVQLQNEPILLPSFSENTIYPYISEFLVNNNEYDDLTEYYPIQKIIHTNTINPLTRMNKCYAILDSESSMTNFSSNYKLSDIILFHKKFLNTQISRLKKLSRDLTRIEKYLLKSNNSPENLLPTSSPLIDCSREKNDCSKRTMRSFSRSSHVSNKCCIENCSYSNQKNKVSEEHKKIANLYLDDSSLFKLKQPKENKHCCHDNIDIHDKYKILKTSIEMIQKIDHLLNNYEKMNDFTNNSVQTSFLYDDFKTTNDNISNTDADGKDCQKPRQNYPLSWFLNFDDCNDSGKNYYKILEPQCVNLQDLFECNCREFKLRSMMRALRIKDNTRLRMETAEQRKDEIVQVYLLRKTCSDDSNDKVIKKAINKQKPKPMTTTKIDKSYQNYGPRPLSPITRRVFTHRQMRTQTEKAYQKLPEFKTRINNGKHKDDAKRRRMMADIFKEKLKDNAVRGKLNWPITSQAIST